jgi:hypothetical protein
MPDNPPETIPWRVKELENDLALLQTKVDAMETKLANKEHALLVRGIMALGAAVSVLGGIIWAYRSVIFRGNP